MQQILLGIDQSTSGTKVVAMDMKGALISKLKKEHQQHYPKPGWVEHDPEEIYNNTVELLQQILEQHKNDEILCLSITNQRETIVFWDKETSLPLCNAFVWQCRRGATICEKMVAEGLGDEIYEKTGLQLDTYFSASKIKWALDNEEAVKNAAENHRLCVGTIDSYLLYRLTEEKVFATDVTNASRTLLYNIHTSEWDESLMSMFGVKANMLPMIKDNNACFGTLKHSLTEKEIPIAGVIGDSQAALFGQQCYSEGKAKITYGTGSSILIYAGTDSKVHSDDLLTSVAWSIDGTTHYALEGIINSSGDTLKWVKDNLGLYQDESEIEAVLKEVDHSEGVYVVPAFNGLGAPYWEQEARAAILGMTRKTDRRHIIRAATESIAYQVADILNKVAKTEGVSIQACYVDGGASQNSILMQMQADLIQSDLKKRNQQELSVIGAIYLGGLGVGLWNKLEDLQSLSEADQSYEPSISADVADEMIDQWRDMVKRVL